MKMRELLQYKQKYQPQITQYTAATYFIQRYARRPHITSRSQRARQMEVHELGCAIRESRRLVHLNTHVRSMRT